MALWSSGFQGSLKGVRVSATGKVSHTSDLSSKPCQKCCTEPKVSPEHCRGDSKSPLPPQKGSQKQGAGTNQVVEYLPYICKVLSPMSSTEKKIRIFFFFLTKQSSVVQQSNHGLRLLQTNRDIAQRMETC